MSSAALFVLFVPAVGYICLHKQNKIRSKAKPISGLELTYHSAIYGAVFLVLSYGLVRSSSFFFNVRFSGNAIPYIYYLVSGLPVYVLYFIFASILSFLYSCLFIPSEKNVWHGDSSSGRIWGELLAKEIIIVLFLKNGKCYQGLLTEVEVSERVPLEDRLVSILVIVSGYRDSNGVVDWNTSYQVPLRHHFCMSEIVNFSEYASGATFKIQGRKRK